MNKEILSDHIIVYRNAIPHNKEIIRFLKNYQLWEKWYDVGEQIVIPAPQQGFHFESYPTKEEWDTSVSLWKQSPFFQKYPSALEDFYWFELEDIFYNTVEDYLNTFPINDLPNWHLGGVNILKYDAKKEEDITTAAGGSAKYVLPFHTDFHYETADQKGLKPAITVTMYFNDDYEGGDIEYRVFNKTFDKALIDGVNMVDKETGETVPGFNYRPQAGDIIIFPSRMPYYHGVKKVTKGQKLFLRTFWMYNQE